MTEPMHRDSHILLVVSSLSAGGAERVISEMAAWWAARNQRVTVLTFAGTDQDHYLLSPGVERIALDFWKRANSLLQAIDKRIYRFLRLRASVIRAHPDVVVSFIDVTNMRTLTGLLGTGIPVIVSERIDPRHHPIGYFWRISRRILYPLAQALVVQTRSVAAWASHVVPERKIHVISNFIRPLPGRTGRSSDTEPEQPYVLAIGRLDRQKGHDLLIRAFAATGAARSGWRLVILGEGPERPNLERLASELGIQGAVSMPGVVREPAEWLYKARLFVLSSRYEGFPNALLEAMACGCAVIAADCPSGPAEIVRDGENGLLVPAEDVHALSSAMLSLMGDEGLCRRLGTQALQVRSAFSQDSVMALWDDLIGNVLNSWRHRG
jgi:GalNAc-alpha-(1->4)-GalNAc-alpha-(1->3)-diNAcBac-PP-undecaprenol alpha-1,4-N-acetyl-D-galactosaminyltransferase